MPRSMTAAAAALIALTGAAAAQDWPTRPITLVVPFAAGGGIDVSVRLQAQHMSELLGQSFVVENIGGGGRHHRQPARRQGRARRLHADDRQYRHARLQPVAVQAAALQRRHRFHAGRPGVGLAAHPAGPQGPAGEQPAGVHRLCESQPGEDAVRLGRRRLRHASALRPAQPDAQGRHHARALSRRRPGDAGPDRRPHRLLLRHHPDRRAAGQAGDRERHRRDGAEARADHRRPGDHRRAGPAGRRSHASGTRSSFPRERRSRSCASSTRR